jgi:hypothetical protein
MGGQVQITGLSAESLTLHGGTSAELKAVFRTVAETEADGTEKYSALVCKDLAKTIVCRAYAPAILELCHLVNIADACGVGRDRYERFFWTTGVARPANFRAYIDRATAAHGWRRTGFERVENGVRVVYPDGEFTVTFARMPFLSTMAEFLLTALGYVRVDAVFSTLVADDPTRKSVSEQANGLSRAIYDYLKEHLPTAQNQRKFHLMTEFVGQRRGEDFEPADIDDAIILEFWREKSLVAGEEAADFKTYQTVFKSFVRLMQSLGCAREIVGFEDPAIIGMDQDAAELNPETVVAAVDRVEEPENNLLALEEDALERVKFFNRKEHASLTDIAGCVPIVTRIKTSLLRNEVFGKAQNRITQALRKKLDPEAIAERIGTSATEDYDDCISRYRNLLEHTERVLLACLYCLVRLKNSEAISLILALRPGLDLSRFAENLELRAGASGNVEMLSAPSVADHFIGLLEDAEYAGGELSSLVAAARKAYQGLSRQGFREEEIDDPSVVDAMEVGASHLCAIRSDLRRLVGCFQDTDPEGNGWRRAFETDCGQFYDQFLAIYGGS